MSRKLDARAAAFSPSFGPPPQPPPPPPPPPQQERELDASANGAAGAGNQVRLWVRWLI